MRFAPRVRSEAAGPACLLCPRLRRRAARRDRTRRLRTTGAPGLLLGWRAARLAGLKSVGVLCGGFPEAALRSAGCVAVFAGPADLLERYRESPLARGHA